MNIAMIGQKGIPAHFGGVERHVEELALQLVAQGHEVSVYAREWYTPRDVSNYHGIKVVHTSTIHTKNLDAITHTLTATLHAIWQKPDIIHYHGVGPALLSWLPRIFAPRTKVIVTIHSLDRQHKKWGGFARAMLHIGEWAACRFPQETIVVSKVLREYCRMHYHRETTYIPNGVTTTDVKPRLLSKWHLVPFRYVLMVSRLIEHKGAHYLVAAWKRARELDPDLLKNYHLVIAGGGYYSDTYVNKLHALAKNDPSVIFTGWVKGKVLENLFNQTALFVHPSESEGQPIALLEAMASARPALVSDIPEHREVIADKRFWFLSADVEMLARKMIELLGQPKLLKEAGMSNKAQAEEFYSWHIIGKKAEEVYAKNSRASRRLKE